MTNDTLYTCPDCGFRFGVIWCRDASSEMYDSQIGFCPRCGDDDIECEEEDDDDS